MFGKLFLLLKKKNEPSVVKRDYQKSISNVNKEPDIKGLIGFYGLSDWWSLELTELERKLFLSLHKALNDEGCSLITGDVEGVSKSPRLFLSKLGVKHRKSNNEDVKNFARKLFYKSCKFPDVEKEIKRKHLDYIDVITKFYKERDKQAGALDNAIEACKKQIDISKRTAQAFKDSYGDIPSHKGFEQLAIIREKQKNYTEAIALSKQALQQGWSGNWETRIKRCEKKLQKQ